jgi:hypothetical protein
MRWPAALTADMPLHLEDHLDAAVVEGSELPENPPQTVQWHFDEPQPEWNSYLPLHMYYSSRRPP